MTEDAMGEWDDITMDCAESGLGIEWTVFASPQRPNTPRPRARAANPEGPYLSVADMQARWGCGRTFVYRAVAEMEHEGYLRRMRLGRTQRIAIESVVQYEARHVAEPLEPLRSTFSAPRLRAVRSSAPRASQGAESIRDFARKLG